MADQSREPESREPESREPESREPESREPEWKRKARLARIFGDVLPETTDDERGPADRESSADDWLRSQVPPHHGG